MSCSLHLTALAWSLPAIRDGEDETKQSRDQHHAALPFCAGEDFSMGPHRMSLCRGCSGQRTELVLALSPHLSLPPSQEMPWPSCKRLACLVWGDLAEGGCLQALAVSNVAVYKWKQFRVKNNVLVSFVVFLAVPGLGTLELNLSEAKYESWNQDAALEY